MGKVPVWLRHTREMLDRAGSAWLIYTERGPEPRFRLNGNADGHVLVGWYTSKVSDEQLVEDVAHSRSLLTSGIRNYVRSK